jgi:hypothetical protein
MKYYYQILLSNIIMFYNYEILLSNIIMFLIIKYNNKK